MKDEEFYQNFPFEQDRQYQRDIIEAVQKHYDEGKKFVLLCAPTAVGKSAISLTLARYYGSAYFLTSQKSLQDQYLDDFDHLGMRLIKGRANYCCNKNPSLKCDMGKCIIEKDFKARSKCTYIKARNEAYSSKLTTLNYSYFFNMARTPKTPQEPRNLLIMDECIRKGQLVKTKDGEKPIEKLTTDDLVLSYNIEEDKYEFKEVLKTFKNLHKSNSYDHFLQIEMEDGSILEVTPNHKVYTSNRGYVRADELTEDDDILNWQLGYEIYNDWFKENAKNIEFDKYDPKILKGMKQFL